MAINIKELFVTDLDPNSGAWWSEDKVDKINYNFNQLSNGGAPGPQGTIGVDGGFGPIGAQGANGYKGSQGYQGLQGVKSLNDWDYFPESAGLPGYLFPRKNPININQSAPVALRIGFLSTDEEYMDGADTSNTHTQIVKTTDSTWVNLRVEDNNDFNGYNFSFKSSGGNPKFEITPDLTDPNFRIIYTAQTIVLKTGIYANSLTDSITITNSLTPSIIVNGPVFNLGNSIGMTTKSEDAFRFTIGAAEDKILVSTNTSGNVEWKNVKDVFGTFPVGTIISIRASEFITNHFWLNDSINVTSGSPLNNIYGRGKAGTDYEGWYLCNGETWETVDGFNQILTPNLNNFSYTISANGNAQAAINVPELDPILIGGYDMSISAVPNSSGIYAVGYTDIFPSNNTSPGISTITMGTSGLYETSRMIHIVYLENHDLKWSNTGVYIPPISTNTITLTLPANLIVCSAPVTSYYSWNGPNASTWNTFTVPSTTYKLFNSGTTNYAPLGWYINIDGYPIYWDGTNFTQRGTTCTDITPPNYDYNFITSALVDDLNGPSNFIGDLYLDYNSATFIDATTLTWADNQLVYPVGSAAPSGWYRDISSGVRRYWSGSSFVGVSFTENYVSRVTVDYAGQYNPGYNNVLLSLAAQDGVSVCDYFQDSHLTYVAGNSVLTVPSGITLTDHVKNYDSALYVPILWEIPSTSISGEPLNTPPLVNIKDQAKPGSTTIKYNKVYMTTFNSEGDGSDWGVLSTSGISATGKINSVSLC